MSKQLHQRTRLVTSANDLQTEQGESFKKKSTMTEDDVRSDVKANSLRETRFTKTYCDVKGFDLFGKLPEWSKKLQQLSQAVEETDVLGAYTQSGKCFVCTIGFRLLHRRRHMCNAGNDPNLCRNRN